MKTLHATSLCIGDKGLLLTGPSGSGKSQTALCLMEMAKSAGLAFALIVDDQTAFTAENDQIIMHAPLGMPNPLRGKLELRGFGLIDVPYKDTGALDHCFTLHKMDADKTSIQDHHRLPQSEAERPKILVPIGENETLARHALPIFASDVRHSAQIILAEAGFVLPLG